jgi:hypothetical protein
VPIFIIRAGATMDVQAMPMGKAEKMRPCIPIEIFNLSSEQMSAC